MDSSRNEFFGIFLEESRKLLTQMGNSLLEIERNPYNKDTIDEFFRFVHTIKGTSKQLESHFKSEFPEDPTLPILYKIGLLTHNLEDFLTLIRTTMTHNADFAIDSEQVDLLFQIQEVIETLFLTFDEEMDSNISIDEYIVLLNDLTGKPQEEHPVHSSDLSDTENTINPLLEEELEVPPLHNELKLQLFLEITEDRKSLLGAYAVIAFRSIKERFPHCVMKPSIKDMMSSNDFVVEDIYLTVYAEDTEEGILSAIQQVDKIKEVKVLSFSTEKEREAKRLEIEKKKKQATNQSLNHSKEKVETIAVPLKRIDELYKNVSELVITKNKLKNLAPQLEGVIGKEISTISDELDTIVENSQKVTMMIRMTPLEQLFQRFPLDVRRTAKEEKKNVIFSFEGEKTEIDKMLLDELGKPLMHIIRNSISHGIESEEERLAKGKTPEGHVWLRARHDQNVVVIEVEDDGKGIDTEKVKQKAIQNKLITEEQALSMKQDELYDLIFHPGLSTSNEITDLKGRGVGLDFVKTEIKEKMKGSIIIESQENVGTKFTIKLNLSLAIISALIVKINGEVFALPSPNVVKFHYVPKTHIRYVANNEVFLYANQELPVIRLKKHFNLPDVHDEEFLHVVIVTVGKHMYALVVDEFDDEMNIVVRSFGNFLGNLVGISGTFVLPNGDIGLIVDLNSLSPTSDFK